ncbi:MAG TPA: hypothetical protein VLZ32_04090 [Rhodanobacter sp.]|nr:hypothetical protein [Rhodanobacter sp.]
MAKLLGGNGLCNGFVGKIPPGILAEHAGNVDDGLAARLDHFAVFHAFMPCRLND